MVKMPPSKRRSVPLEVYLQRHFTSGQSKHTKTPVKCSNKTVKGTINLTESNEWQANAH